MKLDDAVGKVIFQCKHCGNDDIRYMKFDSVNHHTQQNQNNLFQQYFNYETTPKIPVGIHFRCAKCNKDTFIIPDSYGYVDWTQDIPIQCITRVQFEQPKYSSIKYIINANGFLDKVVLTSQNQYVSIITEEVLVENSNDVEINEEKYNILLKQGLKEVTKSVAPLGVETQIQNNNFDTDIHKNKKK